MSCSLAALAASYSRTNFSNSCGWQANRLLVLSGIGVPGARKKRVLPGGGPSYPLPAATYPGRASRCCPQAFAHPDHLRRVPPAARRRRYAHVAPARPRPLELTSQISRRVLWPPGHSLWMLCSRTPPRRTPPVLAACRANRVRSIMCRSFSVMAAVRPFNPR
jgi:hypothetical protein